MTRVMIFFAIRLFQYYFPRIGTYLTLCAHVLSIPPLLQGSLLQKPNSPIGYIHTW